MSEPDECEACGRGERDLCESCLADEQEHDERAADLIDEENEILYGVGWRG